MNRPPILIWLVAILLLLNGCAGEREFNAGKHLLDEGKMEEGIAQIKKAVKADPKNVEYRSRLIKEKDALMQRELVSADAARKNGRLDEAEKGYREVLNSDNQNERAVSGLDGIQSDRRHLVLLKEAENLYKKGAFAGAQNKVRDVLMEDPKQPEALALQTLLDEKTRTRSEAPELKSNIEKTITLEFQDVSLKSVFDVISRVAGINFVFDKDINPALKATIFVKNTTVQDAIRLLLVTNQLDEKILNQNTVLIYPNTALKSRDYQDLIVKSFYLSNADVKQTMSLIKTILKTKDIFVDEKIGLLTMRDTPAAIRMAEKLVAAQDLEQPEVMLDVEVLEVDRSRILTLGLEYPNQFSVLTPVPQPATSTVLSGGVVLNTAATTTQLTLDSLKHLNATQIGIPNPVLNLSDLDSEANLLANPRIRVKNREKANIHIGDKVPVITTTSMANVGVAESVSYLDVGLKLEVEPTISLNNDVSIKVGLEVSNIVNQVKDAAGTQTYQIGTRTANTVLSLKDGETQVLGGLLNDSDSDTANKVPGLGDIPLFGRLFANHLTSKTKTEVVLLITPHIVRNLSRPVAGDLEFMSGTESMVGGPSIGPGSFVSGPVSPAQPVPELPPVALSPAAVPPSPPAPAVPPSPPASDAPPPAAPAVAPENLPAPAPSTSP